MSKRHTTHFDDCGCLTEKITNAVGEIVKLEAKLEESEALVRRLAGVVLIGIRHGAAKAEYHKCK